MFSKKEINIIRDKFPILKEKVYSNKLVYVDNAATTQKPIQVINASKYFYSKVNSNIHRGVYYLSQKSTTFVENTRKKLKKFINAKYSSEILFTKGTTESINLIATSLSNVIQKGDEIIISYLEHHSNIVPWQILCKNKNAILKIIPIKKDGFLDLEKFENLISKKTKIVSISHISNVLGIVNPIKYIVKISHSYGSMVLVDGAQASSDLCLNVQDLDVDFYTFSAHKMYGPTGIGMLYGKKEILNNLYPYQFGGEMIKEVSFKKTTYSDLPFKFEAGTPNIEGIFVWGEALNFIEDIGLLKIQIYKKNLIKYALKKLSYIKEIKFYGCKITDFSKKSSIISFNLKNKHCFDIGCILDKLGISVRTGSMCAQPLMNFFKVTGMVRLSFSIYNTFEEIDYIFESLLKVRKILK